MGGEDGGGVGWELVLEFAQQPIVIGNKLRLHPLTPVQVFRETASAADGL